MARQSRVAWVAGNQCYEATTPHRRAAKLLTCLGGNVTIQADSRRAGWHGAGGKELKYCVPEIAFEGMPLSEKGIESWRKRRWVAVPQLKA